MSSSVSIMTDELSATANEAVLRPFFTAGQSKWCSSTIRELTSASRSQASFSDSEPCSASSHIASRR